MNVWFSSNSNAEICVSAEHVTAYQTSTHALQCAWHTNALRKQRRIDSALVDQVTLTVQRQLAMPGRAPMKELSADTMAVHAIMTSRCMGNLTV